MRTSYADESQPESGQAPGHVATVRAAGKPAVLSTSGLRLHQGAWASIGFNDAGDGAGHALALPLFPRHPSSACALVECAGFQASHAA